MFRWVWGMVIALALFVAYVVLAVIALFALFWQTASRTERPVHLTGTEEDPY